MTSVWKMSKEHRVASTGDLEVGQMKEIEVAGTKVLLARLEDGFHAVGATCPHKGAPMVEGALIGSHLRCPWHQAVFDAGSGRLLEPCSLDSLPNYELRVEGGDVYIRIPEDAPDSCEPEMVDLDPEADGMTFVILGSGAAGMAAAETLRSDGFKGRIIMVTREDDMPYDRTELSKWYLGDPGSEEPLVRSKDFYDDHGIQLLLGREVEGVEAGKKFISFTDGSKLAYDRLLLATGSNPRHLGVPGEDLDNVLVLRSLADCRKIRELAREGSSAVVVGASFIAMEVSAFLRQRGVEITVVGPDEVPFGRVLGPEIGGMYRAEHETNGVNFRLGRRVSRFEGRGSVSSAVLDDGEKISADFVVLGVGVTPSTGYLRGFDLNGDGSVTVNGQMRVCEDIYAAGDIATFPDWRTGTPIRIEHWRQALQLGRLAAHNMSGKNASYSDVPFFWTFQFSVNVKYAGYAVDWDEIIYDGDPSEQDFVAYYVKGGRVEAAAACNQTLKICKIAEMLGSSIKPTVEEIRSNLQ